MKKINFLLVALLTFSFSACKKEAVIAPTLVGKWNFVSTTGTQNGSPIPPKVGVAGDYVDFKSSGVLEKMFGGTLTSDTYVINGNKVTITTSGFLVIYDIIVNCPRIG